MKQLLKSMKARAMLCEVSHLLQPESALTSELKFGVTADTKRLGTRVRRHSPEWSEWRLGKSGAASGGLEVKCSQSRALFVVQLLRSTFFLVGRQLAESAAFIAKTGILQSLSWTREKLNDGAPRCLVSLVHKSFHRIQTNFTSLTIVLFLNSVTPDLRLQIGNNESVLEIALVYI